MRILYLVRHGEVDFHGVKRCIGRTDLPLSERGKKQAARLGNFFVDKALSAIYASPAQRAHATAEIASCGSEVIICDALHEIDMGDWEGLTFAQIREQYPELYVRRGQDPDAVPPNGETLCHAQMRALAAIEKILSQSEGNIAVVAHSGINRLLICKYRNCTLGEWMLLAQPCGCVNVVRVGEQGPIVEESGRMPGLAPDEAECFKLLEEKGTPPPVIEHCRAVADKALEIAGVLAKRGVSVNRDLVYAGALLHDIARDHKRHAQTGAAWLRNAGWSTIADIIAAHEDLGDPVKLDEAAVVFLADKLIRGTGNVSLEERFNSSLEKCHDEAAQLAHERRYQQALWLREQIEGA